MKIALPSNGTQVDGHFGHCEAFTIFTIDDGKQIVDQEVFTPPPGCGCKSNVIPGLASQGVSVMLAGNMGGGAVNILQANGIQVIRGCSGGVREVTEAWLSKKIEDSGASCETHGAEGCSEHA